MRQKLPSETLPPHLRPHTTAHAESAAAVLARFQSTASGLSPAEAQSRLALVGENTFPEGKQRTLLHWVAAQFNDRLVWLLLTAATLSLLLGGYRDASVLFAIVLGNIIAGVYQEWKADRILQSLRTLEVPRCNVLRAGVQAEVDARHLVPGDSVIVREGELVPADLRLVRTSSAAAAEFILTGESDTTEKDAAVVLPADAPLAEHSNRLYQGTVLTRGVAQGVVVATGRHTVVGRLAAQTQTLTPPESVLQQAINRMAGQLSVFALVLGAGAFLAIWALGEPIVNAIIFAVGLAAALVPSGLAAEVTMGMALGTRRMAKQKTVVKQLQAVEAIGAASVIATDKTGTLTENKMCVTRLRLLGEDWLVEAHGYAPTGQLLTTDLEPVGEDVRAALQTPATLGFLASEGTVHPPDEDHSDWYAIGDPTDAAFATLAGKVAPSLEALQKTHPVVHTHAFDPGRKCMSVVRQGPTGVVSYVKGSLEALLQRATHIEDANGPRPITQVDARQLTDLAEVYASEALRIIAVGYRSLPESAAADINVAESNLTLAGFAAMHDPPRKGVDAAIREALSAGIRIVMITGDNGVTARAVAQQVGMVLPDGNLPAAFRAHDLLELPPSQCTTCLQQPVVLAYRATPDDKLAIVQKLQALGEVVAVTGDGVNDTLSLKQADIGVAMGESGTHLAQSAAAFVLLDDNFRTLVAAVREGRLISRNIRNTITAVLSSNTAELFCMLFSLLALSLGGNAITLAVHILMVDFIAEMIPLLAVMYDRAPSDLMRHPPLRRATHGRGLISRQSVATGFFRGLWALGTYYALLHLHAGEAAAHGLAVTGVFAAIAFTQFANLVVIRGWRYSLENPNSYLVGSLVLAVAFFAVLMYVPLLSDWLQVYPFQPVDWLVVIGGLVPFSLLLEGVVRLEKRQPTAG